MTLKHSQTLLKLIPFGSQPECVTATATDYNSFYIKTGGSLWATGANHSGQLGDGTTEDRYTPFQVATEVIAVES